MTRPAPNPRRSGAWSSGIGGFIFGIDSVGGAFALASLCFAGPLAAGLGLGTAIMLISTAVSAFLTARFSRVPGAIGTVQDASIAVLAASMAGAGAAAQGGGQAQLATALAVMGGSTLLTGVVLLAMGSLRLSRYARLLPFAVSCGFQAACGFLLCEAAVELVVGHGIGWTVRHGVSGDQARVLLPAIALALLLLRINSRFQSGVAFFGMLIVAVAGFWLLQWGLGNDVEKLIQLGQLNRFQPGALQPPSVDWLWQIDPGALAGVSGGVLAVVILNVLSVCLNLSGIELDNRRDLDFNHETRLAGAVNMLIGLFGGLASYMDIATASLAGRLRMTHRVVGYGYGIAAIVGLVLMGWLIPYFPVFLSTALLLVIGFGLILDWLWAVRRQIDGLELAVAISVVAMAVLVDIIAAIGLGILLSGLSFAVAYARTPLVGARWSARNRRSVLDRAPATELWLSQHGDAIQGLSLYGHIYFGRLDLLRHEIRQLRWPEDAPALPRQLILDFSAVSGLDGAACAVLMRTLLQLAEGGTICHLSRLNANCLAALRNWDRDFDSHAGLRLEPDIASAIETAETLMLDHAPPEALIPAEAEIPDTPPDFFRRLDLPKGALLIEAAGQGDEVWYLLSGQLGVFLPTATGRRRLRALAPGNLVGEVALYTNGRRSAEIRADLDCSLLGFSGADLARLEQSHPETAFAVHRWLARGLGEKLVRANQWTG